jgi:hypothetical protein
MKSKLKVHQWTNNTNGKEELHYYLDGKNDSYVIGLNPLFVRKEIREKILKLLEDDNYNQKK